MLVFVVIIYVIAFCGKVRIKDRTFVIGSLILYGFVQCYIIFNSDAISTYHSDFMALSNITKDVAQKPFLDFFDTLRNASGLESIHLKRAFPYTYPLYHFVSSELLYTQLLNMVLVGVTGLCIFDIAKLLVNSTVARCALLFFLFAPIQATYQLMPNYDVSGLFCIAIFQWGLIRILVKYPFFRMKSLIYACIFVTLALFLAGLARTVHIHLALVILLAIVYVVLIQKKPLKSHLVMSGLVFIALFIIPVMFTTLGMKHVFTSVPVNQTDYVMMIYNAPSYNPTGSYISGSFREFTPSIGKMNQLNYCRVLPLSEMFYNPQSMFTMYLKKISYVWSFGGEKGYVPFVYFKQNFIFFASWGLLYSFLFLWGIVRLRHLLPTNQLLGLLVFFPFSYGVLHMFAEAGIRYSYLVFFNSSIIVGLAMESLIKLKENRLKTQFNQWLVLLLGYFVLYYSAPPIYSYFMKHSSMLYVGLKHMPSKDEALTKAKFNDSKTVYSSFEVPLSDAMSSQTLSWEGNRSFRPGKYDITALLSIEDTREHVFDYQLQFLGAPIDEQTTCNIPIKRFIEKVTVNLNQETTPTFSLVLTHQPVTHDDGTSDPCTMKGRLECVWIRPAKASD